ncbi:unnamed protein product [Blepharisma stoltei]|uniref:RING-type domain-containing protein n=1 Tax=Blepharisma stoltei TaxID=1481888 RepID=A0AAU9KLQ2_9CILI|nr:unnamed protein product [Blepharisma stoltei]
MINNSSASALSDDKFSANYVDYDDWYSGTLNYNMILQPTEYNPNSLFVMLYSPNSSCTYTLEILQNSSAVCPNDCSGNGKCVSGTCECLEDFIGKDCSIQATRISSDNNTVFLDLKSKQSTFLFFDETDEDVEIKYKAYLMNVAIYTKPAVDDDSSRSNQECNSILPSIYEYEYEETGSHITFRVKAGDSWYFQIVNNDIIEANIAVDVEEIDDDDDSSTMTIIYCTAGSGVLLIIGIIICVTCKLRCLSSASHINESPGIEKAAIKRYFPKKLYKDKHADSEYLACPICLDNFSQEDYVRELYCKHIYHKNCIDPWFKVKSYCCLCKKDFKHPENLTGMKEGVNMVDNSPQIELQGILRNENQERRASEEAKNEKEDKDIFP